MTPEALACFWRPVIAQMPEAFMRAMGRAAAQPAGERTGDKQGD